LSNLGGRFGFIGQLAELDHAEQLLRKGRLEEAVLLLENLCQNDHTGRVKQGL